MALKLKTAPATTPITLAEAKAHLRVDTSDEDALITGLINAATQHLDAYDGVLGQCIVSQVWELYYDSFPSGDLEIPLGPVISIDSVEYVDPTTLLYVTWNASNYETDLVSLKAWVIPKGAWPAIASTSNAVRVTFTAGFNPVPQPIKQAILLLVGHWFENRAGVVDNPGMMSVPYAVDALIAPLRRLWL